MVHYPDHNIYSERYYDDAFEYRHVILTKECLAKARGFLTSSDSLLTDRQWRQSGIQMSAGWVHYLTHKPEPHVMCFRRAKDTNPATGLPPQGWIYPHDERTKSFKTLN